MPDPETRPDGPTPRERDDAARAREREERHRLIVESARDYAILTTDADGIIESWSPGAEAVFGWSAAEAVGQPLDITFVPEERAAGVPDQERAEARANGAAPDVRWHLRSDGARVFIDGITRAVPGPGAETRGFLKIGQDVTRRRQMEDALRESEERFRAVANLVPDLLWQSAPDGRAGWFNDRWHEYTGQTPAQAAGWGWTEALHPEDRARSADEIARATAEARALRLEERIRAADGGYRWFLLRAEPQLDAEGRIVRWFGAATDVHAQRMALEEVERRVAERTAELARAWEARGEALRQLVTAEENERRRLSRELHDSLGQLVTGMMLALKTLRRTPDQAGAIAELERLAERIAREMQTLAMELRPPALDNLGLGPALRAHLEEWSDRTGVACDFHSSGMAGERLAPEVESTVYRVMQEGLTNVLKHAGATHVGLVLERRRGLLSAILEDDGRGFDPPAAIAAAERARRLGLRGMRERIALLGGELEIESAPGAGTTLFVRIPDPEQARGPGEGD